MKCFLPLLALATFSLSASADQLRNPPVSQATSPNPLQIESLQTENSSLENTDDDVNAAPLKALHLSSSGKLIRIQAFFFDRCASGFYCGTIGKVDIIDAGSRLVELKVDNSFGEYGEAQRAANLACDTSRPINVLGKYDDNEVTIECIAK